MNDLLVNVALIGACSLALVAIVITAWRMRRTALHSVHITSRFPVFDARDQVRWAMACKSISGRDANVQLLDEALNKVLRLEHRDDFTAFLSGMVKKRLQEKRDPSLTKKRDEFMQQLKSARDVNPTLDHLFSKADDGLLRMLKARTTWLTAQGFRIRISLLMLFLRTLLACLQFGLAVRASSIKTMRIAEFAWSGSPGAEIARART